MLADTLRTDAHRVREDHDDTRALRALCRASNDLVETRVQVLNQLQCNLELALPGAVVLFSKPDSKVGACDQIPFPGSSARTGRTS